MSSGSQAADSLLEAAGAAAAEARCGLAALAGGPDESDAWQPAYQPLRPDAFICQVTGCGVSLDGPSTSNYFRRHRMCAAHAKADAVPIGDLLMRFCQQCGALHPLDEFDGTRKSCRVQLDRHNSRRRCRRKDPPAPTAKQPRSHDGSRSRSPTVGPGPVDAAAAAAAAAPAAAAAAGGSGADGSAESLLELDEGAWQPRRATAAVPVAAAAPAPGTVSAAAHDAAGPAFEASEWRPLEGTWGAAALPQPGTRAPAEPLLPPRGVQLLPHLSLQQLRLHVAAAVAAGRGPALTAVRSTGFVQQLMLVDELANGLAAELERHASVHAQTQTQPHHETAVLPAQLLVPPQPPALAAARRMPAPPAACSGGLVPPAAPPGAPAGGGDPTRLFASLLARLTGRPRPPGVDDEPAAADAAAPGVRPGGQAQLQLVMQLAELLQRHYEK